MGGNRGPAPTGAFEFRELVVSLKRCSDAQPGCESICKPFAARDANKFHLPDRTTLVTMHASFISAELMA